MTSDAAFVWVWLPGAEDPVVAGRVDRRGGRFVFGYGRSYLARADAIALYAPELPLGPGAIEPGDGLDLAGCLQDAGPDAWGRRVILGQLLGAEAPEDAELDHLTYLLNAGSDRIGGLDFQTSPTAYVPRGDGSATLEQLARFAELVQAGEPVPATLEAALTAGSSVGGARPKALLRDGDRRLIAKFSSLTDEYPIVRGEFVAMRMAALCGLDVASVELTVANGKDVLVVERFDRVPGTRQRRLMVSALTLLGLPEFAPREASYGALAEIVRERFAEPRRTLRELFARITFNVACGNTDDHARNHAAFWDGRTLTLMPAYDVCPYLRGGGEATQAMMIGAPGDPFRFSRLAGCVERAGVYGLRRAAAREIVDAQLATIDEHWDEVCDEGRLTTVERRMFKRVFPHPYALEGLRS
jgi:serine/threonine-protein kinase HipA